MAKTFAFERSEKRVPMEVRVQISGHQEMPGVEATFTENVSARGARVLTARRWQREERLRLALVPGEFNAVARVAYCQPLRGSGFAVGLEFLEPSGRWVIGERPAGENH